MSWIGFSWQRHSETSGMWMSRPMIYTDEWWLLRKIVELEEEVLREKSITQA